jgi:hypothetical protein
MAYIELTTAHNNVWLELHNGSTVTHGADTGRFGEWKRDAANLYTDEVFLRIVLSDLIFSTIHNVDLEFTSNSQGSQGVSTLLTLWEQDKAILTSTTYPNARFDDFAQTAWASALATLTVQNTGTYTLLNTPAFKAWVQSVVDFGQNDNGMIMGVDWGAQGYYLTVDSVKMKITYTPPTIPLWGMKHVVDSGTLVDHCRLLGGVSPDIDDMKITSIQMACRDTHSDQIRLGVYTGGSLSNPTGASLLYDFGVTSGSVTDDWITINHPSDGVSWPKNTNTWLGWKGNDNGFGIFYTQLSQFSGDTQSARGRWSSTSISTLESSAWPSSIPSGGSFSDFWYPIIVRYTAPNLDEDRRGLYRGEGVGIYRGI